MDSKDVRILSLKYGNIPHYEWRGKLLEKTNDYIIIKSSAPRKLIHHTKGETFDIPGYGIEYFSLSDWYTVSLTVIDGKVDNYYCNIALPSLFDGDTISFVDLDLDVTYTKEKGWFIEDVDEFFIHHHTFGYSKALRDKAIKTCRSLLQKAKNGESPFDETLTKYIK